jgi:hypothetical protein
VPLPEVYIDALTFCLGNRFLRCNGARNAIVRLFIAPRIRGRELERRLERLQRLGGRVRERLGRRIERKLRDELQRLRGRELRHELGRKLWNELGWELRGQFGR